MPDAVAPRGAAALMRAVVVALGKIGLPLAAQHRARRARGRRLRHRRARRRPGQRRARAVPRRGRPGRGARARSSPTAGCARRPTPPRPSPRAPTSCVAVPPLVVDAQRAAGLARSSTPSSPTSAAGCATRRGPHRRRAIETTLPVGTTRDADRAGARGGQRAARGRARLLTSSSARSASSAAASSPTSRRYPKLVGGLSAEGEARGVELYALVPATPRSGAMGSRGGGRAGEARRDDLPRPQHRLRQRARALRRHAGHRRRRA